TGQGRLTEPSLFNQLPRSGRARSQDLTDAIRIRFHDLNQSMNRYLNISKKSISCKTGTGSKAPIPPG
ncbi:hypothetical protein, partial [Leptospira sp. SA-E8]|uniref:hypothetical protein n=1 Tax=Leptospira sp. SA-E8 TaxID=3422259 RepID=UPI003EBB078A